MFHVSPVYIILILLCKIFLCSTSSVQVQNDVDVDPCPDILSEFATATSNFTSCSIKNSYPITFCETCIEPYINMLNAYSNMSKVKDNETNCLDRFINLDRLQIVKTQYSNSMDLWNRGKCYECFVYDKDTPTTTQSNETKIFHNYFRNYQSCTNASNGQIKDLCNNCMEYYVTLHDYYLGISNTNEKISTCIDVVDLMNSTWRFWSKNCCIYRKHNEYIFIISTVGVFLATVFFYGIVKFSAEKRTPTLVQQTRFAESVSSFRT